MYNHRRLILLASLFVLAAMACQLASGLPVTLQALPTPSSTPANTPTPLPPIPVQAGEANPDEPVYISGDIPYTSPFFLSSSAEPFVMLEDEAGFVKRDKEFVFPLREQVIGPVEIHPDKTLTYDLSLPTIPQGTQVDVDNNGKSDTGVQVFAVAYWSNTWGGPFLEKRDGTGWSDAYTSTITDPENKDEIVGGTLVVWAPDDQQGFPTGFGADKLLFTADDPTGPIPAGYTLVELNKEPFRFYKEARPKLTLNEGVVAVNDFSKMSYTDAFEAMFKKASREYPFTAEKGIDWQALHDQFAARVAAARNKDDFYTAIRDFTYAIPDEHVGLSFNQDVFLKERGGSFGLVLTQLSDGKVIVSQALPGAPGEKAGIKPGAQILTWNDQPVDQAISQVTPYFGPYSTEYTRRLNQVIFLTRVPPDTNVSISFQNPGESQAQQANMQAVVEYDSLLIAVPSLNQEILDLPVQAKVLQGSGLGYIRVSTFNDDSNLEARLWERYIQSLIDNKVPGLIIDLRSNGGGSGSLAMDFAGFFFDEEINLYRRSYYNERQGKFEALDTPARIDPAPQTYDGPIAVLVSPDCVSACEGFAYALKQGGRSTIVGNYPTAGAFGEVGRGQYKLPEGINLQFPTGRPETPDGKVVIEGTGVTPDISVPVTEKSALGQEDAVLQAAVQALQEKIKP